MDAIESKTEDDRANQRQPIQSHLYIESITLTYHRSNGSTKKGDALKSREDKWGLHKCEAVTQNNKRVDRGSSRRKENTRVNKKGVKERR